MGVSRESEAKEYCLVLDMQLYDWPETLDVWERIKELSYSSNGSL